MPLYVQITYNYTTNMIKVNKMGVFYFPILEEYTICHMQSKNSVITWAVILALILVAVGAFLFSRQKNSVDMMANNQDVSGMVEVKGATAELFEGQNILSYTFYVPAGFSSDKEDDSQTLVLKVGDAQKGLIYFSYEGGRGWDGAEYFNTIIAPKITVPTATSTVHVGSYDWYHVETGTMEWNIAKIKNGEWLMVVESKKADKDALKNVLNTVKVD